MEYYVGIDGKMINRKVKDKNDPTVYLVESKGEDETLTNIGEKGGIIDVSKILEYILENNSEIAESMNMFQYFWAVKPSGKWDLKLDRSSIFGKFNDTKTLFSFKKEGFFGNKSLIMASQDVGNFHYGVTGKANNIFSEKFMLVLPGIVQILCDRSNADYVLYSHGDDPRDQWYIKLGFNYYKKGLK